ncbi:MAG: SDR family oxidoreductase [Actinomycetota bacterium]|nr:SDR family oxidoreductase [Actinomycetota bacterium]
MPRSSPRSERSSSSHDHEPDAPAAGHIVTAYVRNPAKLTTTRPSLIVIEGRLDDPGGIARAVDGADAVISALGPTLRGGATGRPVADGTRNIVEAMKAAGVRRFVGLATPSVASCASSPQSRHSLGFSWEAVKGVTRLPFEFGAGITTSPLPTSSRPRRAKRRRNARSGARLVVERPVQNVHPVRTWGLRSGRPLFGP